MVGFLLHLQPQSYCTIHVVVDNAASPPVSVTKSIEQLPALRRYPNKPVQVDRRRRSSTLRRSSCRTEADVSSRNGHVTGPPTTTKTCALLSSPTEASARWQSGSPSSGSGRKQATMEVRRRQDHVTGQLEGPYSVRLDSSPRKPRRHSRWVASDDDIPELPFYPASNLISMNRQN